MAKTMKKAAAKKSSGKKVVMKSKKKPSAKSAPKKSVKKKPVTALKKKQAVKKAVVVRKAAKKLAVKKKIAKKILKKSAPKKQAAGKAVAKHLSAGKKTEKSPAKSKATHSPVRGSRVPAKSVSSKPAVNFTLRMPQRPAEVTVVKPLKKHKKNKKVRYTVAELKHFRNLILEEQKSILESARANMEALVDKESGEYKGDNLTYASHMAEQGTDEMEREKNYMFVQRDEKYLGYLQDALIRIDQGTYGICIDCRDEPKNFCKTCPLIPKERLEVVPITTHCIECKNLRST